MSFELVLANISKHISSGKDKAAYFISLLKEQRVAKKSNVLQEGQTCKYISFVQSGILRAYYADKEGRESTIMFAMTDWWITDM